jgi:uncharacterized damage-inducible protein DinB
MGALQQIRDLYAYNEWANDCILEAASRLSEEELKRELDGSFGSVEGNLWHPLGTQVFWLARWRTAPPEGMRKVEEGQVLEAIRDGYRLSHAGLKSYLDSLIEADVERVISWHAGGEERRMSLGKILLQVAFHGMHHRAETAMMLTQMGKAPEQLDYMFFELARA